MKVTSIGQEDVRQVQVIRRSGVVRVHLREPQAQAAAGLEEERMARIAGVDLPRNKRIEIALTYIYGIGRTSARDDLRRRPSVAPDDARPTSSPTSELVRLREVIERDYKVEGDLRRESAQNIKLLMDIGCYRGLRHRRGLPVRGQRTHTNARTRKGPREDGRRQEAGAAKK